MKPETSESFTAQEANIVRTEYGSVLHHEGHYHAITQDGGMIVPVPKDVAGHIATVMKIQEKAFNLDDQDAQQVLQTFNCRKSALVVSGLIPIEKSIVEMSASSGESEMFVDIDRLINSGNGDVAVLRDYADFEDVLNNYEGSFPCIVHVFESDEVLDKTIFLETIEAHHRVHSFIVLGEEEEGYVCFQKSGPRVSEPFTITDLAYITHLYRNQNNRTGYFVFGPYK